MIDIIDKNAGHPFGITDKKNRLSRHTLGRLRLKTLLKRM